MIGIGLNWWQAIVVIFVSQLIASLAMAFNSRAATTYHLGYPAISRVVFGMVGSYYYVGGRAVLAAVWYGVQCKCYRKVIKNDLTQDSIFRRKPCREYVACRLW